MSKIIYSGLESSGKSLKIAMIVSDIAWRNKNIKEKTGLIRPIISNLYFSEHFYKMVTEEYKIPIIYWENLDDLIKYENADIIIDEVGNYFDSRMWQDLSLDVRRWLTQGAKCGIEIYGTAQDFAQVDKSFRRLVNNLYIIKKLIGSPRPSTTRPPVNRIWGICMMSEINPRNYKEDNKELKADWFQLPSLFPIQKKYCDMFDTTQKIKRSKAPLLKHEEHFCEHYETPGTFCFHNPKAHIIKHV